MKRYVLITLLVTTAKRFHRTIAVSSGKGYSYFGYLSYFSFWNFFRFHFNFSIFPRQYMRGDDIRWEKYAVCHTERIEVTLLLIPAANAIAILVFSFSHFITLTFCPSADNIWGDRISITVYILHFCTYMKVYRFRIGAFLMQFFSDAVFLAHTYNSSYLRT